MRLVLFAFFACSLQLLSTLSFASEVQKIDDGAWSWPVQNYQNGDRSITSHFWVDVSLANLAFDKRVSIIWTTNDWHSWHETEASFERTLQNGREQWGADILNVGRASERHYGYFWNHLYEQESNDFHWLDSDACDFEASSCSVKVEYAVRYIDMQTGDEFWANNDGKNFSIFLEAQF